MKNFRLPVPLCLLLIVCGAAIASCSDSSVTTKRPGEEISVDEILLKNLRAVRPDSSFEKIENREIVIQISEAEYTLLARYRASADGHMRIDVFSGDTRVYSEGKDDEGVWEWPGGNDAPENVYHDGVGALEHGVEFNLFPLAQFTNRGHRVELEDSETIRDKDYFVLKITLSDGFETFRYVNADTWLIDLSRDFRAFHPGVDDTKKNIETRYDQWQRTDGMVFATRSQNVELETGAAIATTLVLASRYNINREELDLARTYVPDGAPEIDAAFGQFGCRKRSADCYDDVQLIISE